MIQSVTKEEQKTKKQMAKKLIRNQAKQDKITKVIAKGKEFFKKSCLHCFLMKNEDRQILTINSLSYGFQVIILNSSVVKGLFLKSNIR